MLRPSIATCTALHDHYIADLANLNFDTLLGTVVSAVPPAIAAAPLAGLKPVMRTSVPLSLLAFLTGLTGVCSADTPAASVPKCSTMLPVNAAASLSAAELLCTCCMLPVDGLAAEVVLGLVVACVAAVVFGRDEPDRNPRFSPLSGLSDLLAVRAVLVAAFGA